MKSTILSSQAEREDGFTMVEILVVIIIIGILAAIAVPIYLNQRKAANDAVVKSDLRSTAMTYTTWRTGDNISNAEYKKLSGGSYYVSMIGEGADYVPSSATYGWNDIEGVPKVTMSDGVFITLVVNTTDGPANGWHRKHDEGEFCMVATHPNSSYDYKAGSAAFDDYDSQLFYDSSAGGVKEMSDLVKQHKNGEKTACYLYVERYIAATGG